MCVLCLYELSSIRAHFMEKWIYLIFLSTISFSVAMLQKRKNYFIRTFEYNEFYYVEFFFFFYFLSDPAVNALQFLDVINMKDPTQKSHFYRNTLREVLPFIPRVSLTRFIIL